MERLQEVAIVDQRWRQASCLVLSKGIDIGYVIASEADVLLQQFLDAQLNIDELRLGVSWANALDHEATRMYGPRLGSGDQLEERTARRIMHHAGKVAIVPIRNQSGRFLTQLECYRRRNLVQ